MIQLKVTRIGDATGVVLSDEALEKLGVKDGDMVNAVETEHGIVLTAQDPEKAKQAAAGLIWNDKDTLGKLAE